LNKYITPLSKSKYLWVFKPNTKFEPVYSITCIAEDTKDWNDLIAELTTEYNNYYELQSKSLKKKLKKCPYFPWKTEEDGTRTFSAKNAVSGVKKDGTPFEIKIHVCGPDREELTQTDLKGMLGAGTEVVVGFTANLWTNDAQGVGLSARLNFVQIIRPVYIEKFAGHDTLQTYTKDESLFNKKGTVKDNEYAGMEIEDLFANVPVG
jgi:hypothetical protein